MRFGRSDKDLLVWRTWFAWHPIFVEDDGKLVWLENVERKYIIGNFFPSGQQPIYRYVGSTVEAQGYACLSPIGFTDDPDRNSALQGRCTDE